MNPGIRGRRAIVAGGSVGLGYASAAMPAAEGVELFLSARGADRQAGERSSTRVPSRTS